LGGVNTYSGPTTVSAGTLRLGADNVIPDASLVSLAGSTVLEVNGKTDTLASLTGSGAVKLGGGFLSVGAANTSFTFGGALSGNGELIKVGTGALTLTGNSPSYTGTTRVSNGTVFVNANQSA